jgi:hypothetical protein
MKRKKWKVFTSSSIGSSLHDGGATLESVED